MTIPMAITASVTMIPITPLGPRKIVPSCLSHLRHLSTAATHAAMRADAMLEAGYLDGLRVWKRLINAVGELLSKERPDGDTVQ